LFNFSLFFSDFVIFFFSGYLSNGLLSSGFSKLKRTTNSIKEPFFIFHFSFFIFRLSD